MKLIADTGALLSLSCSGFSDFIFQEYDIVITPAVLQELEQFSLYADFLGLHAQKLLREKLVIKSPHTFLELNLGKAECEVISVAKEEKMIALTDDLHAARVAKEKYNVAMKPSFYLLLLLYKKKKMSKEELIQDIHSILKYRNWLSGALWEYALQLIEKLP